MSLGQQPKISSTLMKALLSVSAVAVFLTFFFSGCSTAESRIQAHQEAYNASTPSVQAKLRAGRVEVGFTQEQVLIAMGEPDRRYTRTTALGTTVVWAYTDHKPAVSVGFSMAAGGGSSLLGGGVALTTGGDRYDDLVRVVIWENRVVAVESSGRA